MASSDAALQKMANDPHASAHYLHALDYIMYGQLQLGNEEEARQTLEQIQNIEEVYPAAFAAYNSAAPQARYYVFEYFKEKLGGNTQSFLLIKMTILEFSVNW